MGGSKVPIRLQLKSYKIVLTGNYWTCSTL